MRCAALRRALAEHRNNFSWRPTSSREISAACASRRRASRAAPTGCGSTPAAKYSSAARTCPRITNSISRPRASGPRTRLRDIATAFRSRTRSWIRALPCAAPQASSRSKRAYASIAWDTTAILRSAITARRSRCSSMKLGIDRLLEEPALRRPLAGKRVALLAHPASVTRDLAHSLDALAALDGIKLEAAFGAQHGLRGDKQDNMIESPDFTDPVHGIPVFSLYGSVRRPTAQMMDSFDVLLVDLQDVGCRVYTFLTTLRYVLEESAGKHKTVWVLDRPNPAGRPIEGLRLRPGWESFVGAGPLPMRHGLTLGEAGKWLIRSLGLDLDYHVVAMQGWAPEVPPGYGWPLGERAWVNPSPNAANPWMARCYPGTVLLEGTLLSEGRGTTRPLEVLGGPRIDPRRWIATMESLAPEWMAGCRLRPCWFEPTFQKHAGALCAGVQIHVDDVGYDHDAFRPWRLIALAFKALRQLRPEYELWRTFEYEYERDRLAIDVLNGSELLRRWVDDPAAAPADLDALAGPDEEAWCEEREAVLLYR